MFYVNTKVKSKNIVKLNIYTDEESVNVFVTLLPWVRNGDLKKYSRHWLSTCSTPYRMVDKCLLRIARIYDTSVCHLRHLGMHKSIIWDSRGHLCTFMHYFETRREPNGDASRCRSGMYNV